MSDRPETTDILARIQRELAHPIMRHSGSGEVEEETLLDAAAEIERLRAFIRQVADAPDVMACRIVRDAAREVLGNGG